MGYLHGGLVDWEVTERWPIHAGGWLRMLLGGAEVVQSRHAATR